MQFKFFKKDRITELDMAIEEWTNGFSPETDFEVQYKPIATSCGSIIYTAFVQVKWNTNVRIVG